MATRRAILAILAVAVFFPACAALEVVGLTHPGPQATPEKLTTSPQAAPPGALITVAATTPSLEVQAQPGEEQEGEEEEETETETDEAAEVQPVPPPPTAKEGPPVVSPRPVPGRVEGPGVPAVAPPAAPAVKPGAPQFVSLNFDNADLELVLRSIADITGINFILAPGVKAPVTMHSTKVPVGEVFSILEAILEVNNLAAMKAGPVYKIVPLAVAEQQPQEIQVGKEVAEEPGLGVYVTQIVRLDHLSAEEMGRILQSFLGKGAKLAVHKETNSLIIGGLTSTVRRILETIKVLDTPTKRDNVQQIFVYFVENVAAAELANILSTLYGRAGAVPRAPIPGARPGQPPPRSPLGAPLPTTPQPATPPGQPPLPAIGQLPPGALPPGVEAAPGEVVGDVTIVPDEATNALVIKTSPRNYEFIEATIKKLDIVPKQVLLELMLAQITLSDDFNFSLEEIIRSGQFLVAGAYGGTALKTAIAGVVKGGTAPASGMTFAFVDKDNVRVVLNNLVTVSKAQVLANPHLLTANNKEANIQIGQEVPIPTGVQTLGTTSTTDSGTSSNLFSTFQRKDIGIILKIKPHVNEKRLVSLDIETEQTAVSGEIPSASEGGATFNKTTTKTAVVVNDGQSLLIGGIIRSDKVKSYSGVPFLSSIPLLGYLFRNTTESLDRIELVIMITPHVVASPEEGQALTKQFRERVESLELLMQQAPKLPVAKP